MTDPLEKPDGLNWDPAAVELPQVPMLPPGEDAMSATIAAVLPTLTAPLAASVAALSVKENMFRGKLGTAESAYQNADDSGQQSMGQLAGMLGQVGQTGMFGSMMQQAMQGAQGAGGQSSGGQGGATGAAGSPLAGGQPPQQSRDDAAVAQEQQAEQAHEPPREEREPLQRAETDDRAMAGPSGADDGGHGQVPVAPPERHRSQDDLSRRM